MHEIKGHSFRLYSKPNKQTFCWCNDIFPSSPPWNSVSELFSTQKDSRIIPSPPYTCRFWILLLLSAVVYQHHLGFWKFCFYFFWFVFKQTRGKTFLAAAVSSFWLLSNAKASGIQEFICCCQQEITDPKKGVRTWTGVIGRDQQSGLREASCWVIIASAAASQFQGTPTAAVAKKIPGSWLIAPSFYSHVKHTCKPEE